MSEKIAGFFPLPDCITINKSKLHGLGLFAIEQISSGYDLGVSHIIDERFPNKNIRTPIGAFINHSTDQNCELIKDEKYSDLFRLKTVREIKIEEELTLDYTPWYDGAILKTFN